jgi:hypothetical protein
MHKGVSFLFKTHRNFFFIANLWFCLWLIVQFPSIYKLEFSHSPPPPCHSINWKCRQAIQELWNIRPQPRFRVGAMTAVLPVGNYTFLLLMAFDSNCCWEMDFIAVWWCSQYGDNHLSPPLEDCQCLDRFILVLIDSLHFLFVPSLSDTAEGELNNVFRFSVTARRDISVEVTHSVSMSTSLYWFSPILMQIL